MAALLWQAAGMTPGDEAGSASVRIDTLQARSREFLRRGLFLSGLIHIALLVAFVPWQGRGDEGDVRSYARVVELFREPVPPIVTLPPSTSPAAIDGPDRPGIFAPVPEFDDPLLDLTKFVSDAPPIPGPERVHGGQDVPRRTGTADPPPADPGRVYDIKSVEVPPVPIEAPKPDYPEYAREAWITGRVVSQLLVRPDGSVARVRVTSGIKILGDAAEKALYRWRFRPAKVNGRPVAVWVEIPINFTL